MTDVTTPDTPAPLKKARAVNPLRLLRQGRAVAQLNRRVAELEREVQECRRLNRRVAELTDIVQELLIPLSNRDEEAVRERLERYSARL